jgi:hypothetical protein
MPVLRYRLSRDRFTLSLGWLGANLIRRGQAQHSYLMSCSGSVFGTPAMRLPGAESTGVRVMVHASKLC